jgi:hypothetical protein
VLLLLAAGHPNQKMDRELVVSLRIVKKHATHVLASWARPTAPRQPRARALGLIP